MNRNAFTTEVEKKVIRIFTAEKNGQVPTVEQTSQLQGFIQAGIFLGLVKLSEMQQLMENVHMSVYGQTMEKRKLEQPGSWSARAIDYSIYDSPTYTRSISPQLETEATE
jgi:hypothetical protein